MIAKKSVLGMWVFLVTEILFFGGLFVAYGLNFYLHPEAFKEGVRHMDLTLGSLNTGILLTSSWAIAVAAQDAQKNRVRRASLLFISTVVMGVLFLVVKFTEYAAHAREHLVPSLDWSPLTPMPAATQIFFFMYFVMTLIHALHLFIGISLVSLFGWRYTLPGSQESLKPTIENLGLYWHFVDIVWIFLFPCLYLIGRT